MGETTGKKVVYGTLYNSLDQLVKKGYVQTYQGEPTAERGGRRKVYYQIMEKGIESLKTTKDLHASIWEGIKDLAAE